MTAVVQRVTSASVSADGKETATISKGLLVFLGVEHDDTEARLEWLAEKVAGLRIFTDPETGKMSRSAAEIGGGFLVIPNFTLCADTSHGKRPDFTAAAPPDKAEPMFNAFSAALLRYGAAYVKSGFFGADMRVSAENDGPVTLILKSQK